MMYSTVEIKPSFIKEEWIVNCYDLEGDREEKEPFPSSLGFFHYPTEWGVQKGFDTLKQHMIDRRKAEIRALERTISELEKLELK